MQKQEYHDNCVEEIGEDYVIIKKKINLPKGKTTTKGEYSKLKSDGDCKYPERASCDYGEFFRRCPHMKCISFGKWFCEFNKNELNSDKK